MDHLTFAQLLGNYGEFIGAIAVVGTLVYLAIQIRQNTEMTKLAALQNITLGGAESNNNAACNGDLAEILIRGFSEPDSLTDVERLRFNAHCVALYHHLDAAFQMREQGKLDDQAWAKFEYEIPLWLNIPAVRNWFGTDKMRLSPNFRRYIEERDADTPVPDVVPTFSKRLK